MKKFHTFKDIENCLIEENVSYIDQKSSILEKASTSKPSIASKKMIIICATLVLFISLTSAAIATNGFGLIPEHKEFIQSHDGNILASIYDKKGNCVYQAGIIDHSNNPAQREKLIQWDEANQKYQSLFDELESTLSDDTVALVIPTKELDSYTLYNVLNTSETYKDLSDIQGDSFNIPLPQKLPNGYQLESVDISYDYTHFYNPDNNNLSSMDYLKQCFEEANSQGLDYYYKEYDRLDTFNWFRLVYTDTYNHQLSISIKKGKGTILTEPLNETAKNDNFIATSYNNREYIKKGYEGTCGSIYTYYYIDDILYTISISNIYHLPIEDIMEMVESLTIQS